MSWLRTMISMIVASTALLGVQSSAFGADTIRALWLWSSDTQEQFKMLQELSFRFDQRIEIESREIKGLSELVLAVKASHPDMILGLKLSQVQLLTNFGLLQPIASRDIDVRFPRSLYISPSNRKLPPEIASDQIIAAPMSVTVAALCFDKTNDRTLSLKGSRPSLDDLATGRGIEHIAFPDPRTDPVGRAVLLSAFQTTSLHSGWSLIEVLDAKVDAYTRSYSQDCSEVDTRSKTPADASFTTLDTAKQLIYRNPKLDYVVPRDPILVSNLFAAIVRDRPASNPNLVRTYGKLTAALLETQIRRGDLRDYVSTDVFFYNTGGIFAFKSSGQIVDEWAALYDNKSLRSAFKNFDE